MDRSLILATLILMALTLPSAVIAAPKPPAESRIDVDERFEVEYDARAAKIKPPASEYKEEEDRAEFEKGFKFGLGLAIHFYKRKPHGKTGFMSEPERKGFEAGEKAELDMRRALYREMLAELAVRTEKKKIIGGAELLRQAVEAGDADGAKKLVSLGIDPDLRGRYPTTALSRAIEHGETAVAKALIESKAKIAQAASIEGLPALHLAAHFHEAEKATALIALLLENRVDIETRDAEGRTALSYCDTLEAMRALIKAGAKLNATDDEGRTPLHHYQYNPKKVLELIKAGADVNAKQKDGLTPLDTAMDDRVRAVLREHGGKSSK